MFYCWANHLNNFEVGLKLKNLYAKGWLPGEQTNYTRGQNTIHLSVPYFKTLLSFHLERDK